jgi:alpha-amylase
MMEWSDGSWMNSLKKYPETDQMHKKMCYVSEKIGSIVQKCRSAEVHKKEIEDARKELYKGQCNCGWWHGVFGGLYLYHLRRAIYSHLINADKIADRLLHKDKEDWLEIKEIDFDRDGRNEVILENNVFFVYIDPAEGGVIKEFDYRPLSINLINTLSRKKEPYHQKIVEGMTKDDGKVKTIHDDVKPSAPGLSNKLIYDRFPRYSLQDHFLKPEVSMKDFINSSYENGRGGPYILRSSDKSVILERNIETMGVGLRITKEIQIKSEKEIEFSYVIEKKNPSDKDVIFGVEFNLTMPDLNSDRYTYFYNSKNMGGLGIQGSAQDVDFFSIQDYNKECGIGFSFSDRPKELWYFPVQTVSQSERSYELNYQCSCVFPRWSQNFYKNKAWHLKIVWSII